MYREIYSRNRNYRIKFDTMLRITRGINDDSVETAARLLLENGAKFLRTRSVGPISVHTCKNFQSRFPDDRRGSPAQSFANKIFRNYSCIGSPTVISACNIVANHVESTRFNRRVAKKANQRRVPRS